MHRPLPCNVFCIIIIHVYVKDSSKNGTLATNQVFAIIAF